MSTAAETPSHFGLLRIENMLYGAESAQVSMQDLANEASELIKDTLSNSGVEPNLWSVMAFLIDRYDERSIFQFSVQVENKRFACLIEQESGRVHILQFVKELLSIIFKEMAAVQADISILSNNALKVQVK
jgi:hypothetical protein